MAAIEYIPGWGLHIDFEIGNLLVCGPSHTDQKSLLKFWFHNYLKDNTDLAKEIGLNWAFTIGIPFRDLSFMYRLPSIKAANNGA